MFQALVSGAGLSGLTAFVLEGRHLKAFVSTMASLLRKMAGDRQGELGRSRWRDLVLCQQGGYHNMGDAALLDSARGALATVAQTMVEISGGFWQRAGG
eukprot:9461577-Pyramimonas_sp.AAC.1